MTRRKKSAALVLTGVLAGTMLTDPAVHAAEEYFKAYRSSQAICLDGQRIQLEAYSIGGHNYVKLRDIGKALDFNVYWDGAIQIESGKPYTDVAPEPSTAQEAAEGENSPATGADHSQQANAAIFNGAFTREIYNAIRQAVLDKRGGASFALDPAYRQEVNSVLSNIGTAYQYQLKAQLDGSYTVTASQREAYTDAIAAVSGLLEEINALPNDAAKVRRINEIICDRLTYQSGAITMPGKLFTTDSVLAGNCASYAKSFKFLCDLAGIPCVCIHSTSGQNHGWNMVYVDGAWSHVDCVANDVGDTPDYRDGILMDASPTGPLYVDTYPEITAFCKELLVPGSTK